MRNRFIWLLWATAALLIGALFAMVLTGCGSASPAPPPSIEVEDCDLEDLANREADCGFKASPKPKQPVATRGATRAPLTTGTKRR